MDSILRKAELFTQDCLKHDIPRLKAEVLPDDVKREENDLYDVYYTAGSPDADEAYFLIHGGAFVYGDKINDRNFGMRLAKESGIPVVNANYSLMPAVGLEEQLEELDRIIETVEKKFGYSHLHFTGDSAGGYLAMMCALRHKNAKSASLICGAYRNDRNDFPGALFAKDGNALPDWYYDLTLKADELKGLDVAIITGENDFLREQNRELAALLEGNCIFYDAPNKDGRNMEHVFPITNPDWPEGVRTIEIISSFARKSC